MLFTRRAALGAAAGLAGAALIPSTANALVVQPIQIDMRASGARATALLRAMNDHPQALPVEVTYERLTLPETGAPVKSPATGDEFLIFPPQATIPVGATQAFRTQWVGGADIAESQLFMFSVRQLPVPRPGTQEPGIELLYSIQALVAVAPARGNADLSIVSARRVVNGDVVGAEITVQNATPVHGYVAHNRLALRQQGGGWAQNIEAAAVNSAVGMGLVPGNGRRRFVIPANVPANATELAATLTPAPR